MGRNEWRKEIKGKGRRRSEKKCNLKKRKAHHEQSGTRRKGGGGEGKSDGRKEAKDGEGRVREQIKPKKKCLHNLTRRKLSLARLSYRSGHM